MGLKFNPKQSEGWKLLASPKKTRILFDGGSRSGKTALIGISGQTCIAVSWLKTACRAETPGSCQNITVERYAQILSCPQPAFRRLPFPGERTHDCFL